MVCQVFLEFLLCNHKDLNFKCSVVFVESTECSRLQFVVLPKNNCIFIVVFNFFLVILALCLVQLKTT